MSIMLKPLLDDWLLIGSFRYDQVAGRIVYSTTQHGPVANLVLLAYPRAITL